MALAASGRTCSVLACSAPWKDAPAVLNANGVPGIAVQFGAPQWNALFHFPISQELGAAYKGSET
jgi:hypothetical protein